MHWIYESWPWYIGGPIIAFVMIALMGSLGLLPAALSTGMGSEIQKPLAIMIVGGLIICLVFSFTVLPVVFYYAYRNRTNNKIISCNNTDS